MKTGDLVTITYDGRTVAGVVKLASGNGASLMLEFEAILGGFVGMMPALRDDAGTYRDLVFHKPVAIEGRP
jgi:hypothetical protein